MLITKQRHTFRLLHTLIVCSLALAAVPRGLAQTLEPGDPPAVDVLGAHDNSGRGCASCHSTHSGDSVTADYAGDFWGKSGAPDYGRQVLLGGHGKVVEQQVARLRAQPAEINGILMCLSCHDGNVTPQNMMAGKSYEQMVGLIGSARGQRIPTLLGDTLMDRYAVDHPLGVGATIPVGDGLEFASGIFSVVPKTPYAEFVRNYGWPTLAPVQRSNPYGVDREGQPYLLCTTCHNQHAQDVYASRASSPIAGDNGDQLYTTFFFVNGPYNPNVRDVGSFNTTSNVQFCRQCHFNLANEANNTSNIRTEFF
ncbi:MAG TPA: hypothetical protein VF753_06090 [Terriglobales bacterium]